MGPTLNPRVKICCMGSVAEAWMAIANGAAAVGLVSAMPSGPGVIAEDLIAEIAHRLPPAIGSFLLTCKTDPTAIIEQQRRLRVNTIQICDRWSSQVIKHYAKRYREFRWCKYSVHGAESVAEAISVAPFVNAVRSIREPSLPVKNWAELAGHTIGI